MKSRVLLLAYSRQRKMTVNEGKMSEAKPFMIFQVFECGCYDCMLCSKDAWQVQSLSECKEALFLRTAVEFKLLDFVAVK